MESIGVGGTMWAYAALNVAAFVFIYRGLPELAGRSLEQIEGARAPGASARMTSPAEGARSVQHSL